MIKLHHAYPDHPWSDLSAYMAYYTIISELLPRFF